jgi:hypothetical protein
MSEFKISLLHATFKPENSPLQIRSAWLNRAEKPESIQYIVTYNYDDLVVTKLLFPYANALQKSNLLFLPNTQARGITTVSNWNLAAKASLGKLLLVVSDDLVPDFGWDSKIHSIVKDSGIDPDKDLAVWKLTDFKCSTLREEGFLLRHPLVTRGWYMLKGEIFDSSFEARGCDDALLLDAVSEKSLYDGREIKLHHSVGPILSQDNLLLCQCFSSKDSAKKKEKVLSHSQWLHKENGHVAQAKLKRRGFFAYYILLPLLANSRYSKSVTRVNHSRKVSLKNSIFLIFMRIKLLLRC